MSMNSKLNIGNLYPTVGYHELETEDPIVIATPAKLLVTLGARSEELKVAAADQKIGELDMEFAREALSMDDLRYLSLDPGFHNLWRADEYESEKENFVDFFGYWPEDDNHKVRMLRKVFKGVFVPVSSDVELTWVMRREPEVRAHVMSALDNCDETITDMLYTAEWPVLTSFPVCAEASIIKFAEEH